MALGVTIAAPTSADLLHTEEAYGSFVELAIVCKNNVDAYGWKELGAALSDMKRPLDVDILSAEEFADDAEAAIQSHFQHATVHLHNVPNDDLSKGYESGPTIESFWERTDGGGTTSGHTVS